MRKHIRVVPIAAAALLAIGGASAIGQGEPPEGSTSGPRSLEDRVQEHLAVFRRSVRASDAIPTSLADSPLLSDGVADLATARRIDLGDGRELWLALGRGDAVCVIQHGDLGCPPVDVVEELGVASGVSFGPHEPLRVTGVAADGIREVEASAAGMTASAAVRENAFWIQFDQPLPRDAGSTTVEVRWINGSGSPGRDRWLLPATRF